MCSCKRPLYKHGELATTRARTAKEQGGCLSTVAWHHSASFSECPMAREDSTLGSSPAETKSKIFMSCES